MGIYISHQIGPNFWFENMFSWDKCHVTGVCIVNLHESILPLTSSISDLHHKKIIRHTLPLILAIELETYCVKCWEFSTWHS